jgi:hypothetical protein
MGKACNTYRGNEMCIQCFGGKPEAKDPLEDPGIDGRIILRRNFRKWDGDMD